MNKRTGSTLIELMIVLAILGILFAIAIPKIKQLMDCRRPNSSECRKWKEARKAVQSGETVIINGVEYRRAE